jgi:hypothetical protein
MVSTTPGTKEDKNLLLAPVREYLIILEIVNLCNRRRDGTNFTRFSSKTVGTVRKE